MTNFVKFEADESTITVNVVSTVLLALAMLPNLTITSSEVRFWAKFPEKSAEEGKIFETLNDEKTARMANRYNVSKLLEMFAVREMVRGLGVSHRLLSIALIRVCVTRKSIHCFSAARCRF
jgi:hypothetical protein